jgi:excisionase family DNA binding protein
MSTNPLQPCFAIGEAAKYLCIFRALLYKLIHEGRIKTVKIGARTIVRGAELERFLNQQQAA